MDGFHAREVGQSHYDPPVPLTPDERRLWDRLLALRPHLEAGHDPRCPGVTDLLGVTPETCAECRDWLAEGLREDRRLDAEDRRPKA